jgi:tetratricopeptide (TPR) repeat protein
MATPNSVFHRPGAQPRCQSRLPAFLVTLALTAGLIQPVLPAGQPDDNADPEARFREQAAQQYRQARQRHRAEPDNATLAWEFGRATFDLAEVAHNKQERETLAQEGIEACRHAITLQPDLAAAHYYFGMNLGQLARVRPLRGLRSVVEMQRAFETSRELDPRFDHAGADRNLGLLYHHAPGWPISVGNKSKGRQHLERAVQLSPDYPENRLSLAEALWDTHHHEAFLREVRALETLLPEARETFDPDIWIWAYAWIDWDQRWATLEARAESIANPD